ncbi:MAG: hypothetical protein AAGI68_12260 [Planctomycetota bacterium]
MAVFAAFCTNASAELIFESDFAGEVSPQWTNNTISVSPSGQRFLGTFGNTGVQLNLTGLPEHSEVRVIYDLYIIGTWDGNNPNPNAGPDIFSFGISGDVPIINSTFVQWRGSLPFGQSWPGTFPLENNPTRTAASEINTLGYTSRFWDGGGDTTYSVDTTFSHASTSLSLNFEAELKDSFPPNEVWGIDNIRVFAIPEPSSLLLLVFFGHALALRRQSAASLEYIG